jgi:spermidine synthase
VIDDGRRYLRRTRGRFDVITLDPPPPVEAAGSSLLYSTEFYELLKPRLSDQGILHQWFPGGDLTIFQAVLRSVAVSFPHVRVMRAWDGWGYHILASERPIPSRSAAELAARLPEKAAADAVEWTPDRTVESLFQATIGRQFAPEEALDDDPRVIVSDDRPYNEYYLLRRAWQCWAGAYAIAL